MKSRSHNRHVAFTLLELVVVLGILAVVTGVAVRAIDRVEDQRRFENAQRGMEEIEAAVLGSPDDRAVDGTRTISGFVADMGRLPRTMEEDGVLTLGELWRSPGEPYLYDVRRATADNCVPVSGADPQVLVPGGWRGPYLHLPLGAATLRDAWGNPMISPATASPPNADTTGHARLRNADEDKTPIITPGQEIGIIRHLGANGRADSNDEGYDRDMDIPFTDKFQASLIGQVEVLDADFPADSALGGSITVRVFGPNPNNPAQILVYSATVPFNSEQVTWQIPQNSSDPVPSIGPRVVRAYLNDSNGDPLPPPRHNASGVKNVILRPGMNFLELKIDRRKRP